MPSPFLPNRVKCPVCGGGGEIRLMTKKEFEAIAMGLIPEISAMKLCHACEGSGWVKIRNSKKSNGYFYK